MTMIAIATGRDGAHIMTDTASYTNNGSEFGRTSKVVPYPHMDAALTTQGDGTFGVVARIVLEGLTDHAATFDAVLAELPAALRREWANLEPKPHRQDSTVFLVGYSLERGRFVAFGHASEQDFEPFKINGLHVMPAPWSVRPSKIELERMRRGGNGKPADREEAARLWQGKPPAQAPRSDTEWIALAKQVREQRALTHFCRVFVAGGVYLTELGRGSIRTELVHEYDDSGEEFAHMVAYTEHPTAQLKPCWCGSGETFHDCHLAQWYDEHPTCDCGSGRPFRDCCSVYAGTSDREAATA